jgi:AcrR family transcriptional regulator
MAHTASEHERPLRADARRNRAKVLEAARESFAEEGLDAQVPAIARRAGVGIGTVYRHFPTKDALVAALAEDHFERLVDLTDQACRSAEDPWCAFAELMWTSARLFVEDQGLAEIAATQPEAFDATRATQQRLRARAADLIERAKASGGMRADATVEDIPTMMCALGAVTQLQAHGKDVSWERYLTLMLDGLRAR